MRFDTLQAWLDWQQTLNPKTIELGLTRVRSVFERLGLPAIAGKVITVAGTNGKGSTVAYYENWLRQSGFRVGSYTSPHLLRYNERIRIDLQPVSDAALCQAFEQIDQARGDIALTYFEFGTLAALLMIAEAASDFAILEVGLGGRLDAVNIIDADLAHLTPVGLDHQDWLGDTVEIIAAEKAGILRAGALAVVNMQPVPDSVTRAVQQLECLASVLGRDYHLQPLQDGAIEWRGRNPDRPLRVKPPMLGVHQGLNLAGVLAGLEALGLLEPRSDQEIVDGFAQARCAGRLQKIESQLPCPLWVDVGHNLDAARALAQALDDIAATGRVVVLLGMLADKDAQAFTHALSGKVDEWWLLSVPGERRQSAQQLQQKLAPDVMASALFDDVTEALQHAVSSLGNQDILLATGSFMTVEAVHKGLGIS